ncbi:unnamed protein product [Caenorhabditis angaria]|uniref:Uncharacterized protein n=1 Tax=Caenorhabditis angaria TaxID=860376 RepID=A0A9P1I7V2_9PELO|nr:unnamed protein product [Caenorhabditis angaria]
MTISTFVQNTVTAFFLHFFFLFFFVCFIVLEKIFSKCHRFVSIFQDRKKSRREGFSNYSTSDIAFSKYGEELLKNLEQPGTCRAFQGENNWENDGRLKLRSKTRHLHIFRQLEAREIGQNLHGRRNLSSTILNSECREYRFDQTIRSATNQDPIQWKNGKLILKKSQKIVDYEEPSKIIDFSIAEDEIVNMNLRYFENEFHDIIFVDYEMEKYIFLLRKFTFHVFNSKNMRKKFVLPFWWIYQLNPGLGGLKLDWNTKNESLFIKIRATKSTLFLLFDIFSLKFVTSFVVQHDALLPTTKIRKMTLKNDNLQIVAQNGVFIYSLSKIWEKFGNFRRIPEISDESQQLPIVFEVLKLEDRPDRFFEGSFKSIHISLILPVIFGFPELEKHPISIQNFKNPRIPINLGEKCKLPQNVQEIGKFSEFRMANKNRSCLIFADDSTSTFLVFEKCDLVKYYVANCRKFEEIWRISIFPKVEDRNLERRVEFEREKLVDEMRNRDGNENGEIGTIPKKKKRKFIKKHLRDHIKIHSTHLSNDGQNLIVNLSISSHNQLQSNGYFKQKQEENRDLLQFVYIIDDKNGEILRIIPICMRNIDLYAELIIYPEYCYFSIDQDGILVISRGNLAILEIWEIIESQQFIDV